MSQTQLPIDLDLEFVAELNVRLKDTNFEAEIESSNVKVYVLNGSLVADFSVKLKIFDTETDEVVWVEIDRRAIRLQHLPAFIEFSDGNRFMEITEFQTKNPDRLEELQEICYDQLSVEVQIYAK
jgi:hypothetical protein